MAADRLNNFSFSFVVRNAPRNGPSSSDAWNDSVREISNDLANLTIEWKKLVKIMEGLPNGDQDTAVNAFQFGLDGKHLWVDQDVSASSDDAATYFNSNKGRPNTVKEQFDAVYTSINNEIASIEETINTGSAGLTTAQKNAIGINIFDSSQVSSSTSLDGKSERNRLNLLQLAQDLGGGSYTLDNDGLANLVYSVKDQVDALLVLHNGSWNTDITLSHTGAFTVSQTDVTSSHPGNDAFAGSPGDLLEDLDAIRTRIRSLAGTAAWGTANTALYVGGADSLEDLLTSTDGTGTKTATNPWGYNYSDIDGLNTRLEAIKTFTGQGSQTDTMPVYTSTTYVTGSLENAIGQLDAALTIVSGFAARTFLQLDDTPSSYVGQSGLYLRVKGAEDGVEFDSFESSLPSDAIFNDVTVTGVSSVTITSGINVGADLYVTNSGYGLVLVAPNGTLYRLQVFNDGSITTTAL